MSKLSVKRMKTRKGKRLDRNRKVRRLEAQKRASRFAETIPATQVPISSWLKYMKALAEARKNQS